MKIVYFFALIGFMACVSPRKMKTQPGNYMELEFLHAYKSSIDSASEKVTISYGSLNVNEEIKGDEFVISVNGDSVFVGDWSRYSYMFEVYKDRFLIISYELGPSHAAGPDQFERDHVVIYDIKQEILHEVHLNNIYLTRSKEFLLKAYPIVPDNLLDKQKIQYCAIDSINLSLNKIILSKQSKSLMEFTTLHASIPFLCL